MKRFIGLTLGLMLFCLSGWSQSWVSQAKKAVFSVITYDNNGSIKNTGNGFFITTDGVGVSDYKLFQGAAKAVIVDSEGTQSNVSMILGANDMYDVIKFKVATSKSTPALTLASTQSAAGQDAYILPYSTQKNATAQKVSIKEAATVAEKYAFYTLSTAVSEKNVSCPLMNASGQVLGLIQKGTDTESYAMAADYAKQLSINVLSASDYTLNNVGIAKGLPEDEDQALVYLMTAKGQADYPTQLEMFINQYPDNAEGYIRRATLEVDSLNFEAAEKDLDIYLEKDSDKADAHYNIGFLIYNKSIYIPEPAYKDWNVDKALSEIETAISLSPQPVFIKMKADILYGQQKYEEAYTTYESLLNTDLGGAAMYSYMAQCKTGMNASEEEILGLLEKAMEYFTKPYGTDAAPYLYARALHKVSTGKYREAVTDYNDLEHIYGGRGTVDFYLNRGKAEMQCRMYQQALDDFNEASQLAPQSPEPLQEKAGLQITIKDYQGAIETAQTLINMDAESPYGYRFLGFAQAISGKKAEGKTNLLKAKELGDPNADSIIEKYCK